MPGCGAAGRRVRLPGPSSEREVGLEAGVADRRRVHAVDLDALAEASPATAPSIAIRWSPWESIVPPRRPPVPVDHEAVLGRLDLAAERVQGGGHGRDPVGLLAAQLRGVADRRRPLGEAGGRATSGSSSIASGTSAPPTSVRARAAPSARRRRRRRLSARCSPFGSTSISAPIRSRIASKPVAGRVEPDLVEDHLAAGDEQARRRGRRRPRRSRRERRSSPARGCVGRARPTTVLARRASTCGAGGGRACARCGRGSAAAR